MPLKVAALIPAAGQSRRMGCSKLLLPLPDRPVIACCLEAIHQAGIRDIVLVLGEPYGPAIRAAAAPFGVVVAWNPEPASDMATSLRCGLSQLPVDASGVMVFIPDHPLVKPATLQLLLARHRAEPDAIIIPTFEGRTGHPILLPTAIIARLPQHPTLRDVVRRHADLIRPVPTTDPGVLQEMDSPAEYRALLASRCA